MRSPVLLAALAAAALAIPAAATAQEAPAPIAIDDPMLAPPLPASRAVASWQEALAIVRERSTDLRNAQANVDRAEAQQRTALAGLLPTITGSTTGTYNFIRRTTAQVAAVGPDGKPIFTPFTTPVELFATGSLQITQPIVQARAAYALGTARTQEEAARLTSSDLRRTLAASVADAIVTVIVSEKATAIHRQGLRQALERVELSRRRNVGGAVAGLDVIRAMQDAASARATLVSGDEALRRARESLGLALGLAEPVGVAPSLDAAALEAATRAICKPVKTVDERSDVAAARAQEELGRRAVTDAQLAFAPTLTAQSTLATTTIDTGAAPNTTWNVQAVLQWLIWDGGARYGALRDTKAQAVQAAQRLELARRTASIQVLQALRAVDVAEQALAVAVEARDVAAESDRLTRIGYEQGANTSIELVLSASALRQAELNRLLREYDLVRARIAAHLTLSVCDF
jgi:outer membrane protein TolC